MVALHVLRELHDRGLGVNRDIGAQAVVPECQGVHPPVMQKLAGHSTARITMEIYTHANMDAQREAMDAMQQTFTQKKEGAPGKGKSAA